jgi:2,4-didehydro-3-deoxy-L-rhamnonate hydrolase
MKLYTFKYKDQVCVGAEKNGGVVNLSDILTITNMVDFISRYHRNLVEVRNALDAAQEIIPFSEVKIQAPVMPGHLFCSGLNYKSHVHENPNAKFLDEPRFFAKLPTVVIGPNEPIRHPGVRFLVDYEVELAVVFGRPAYRLTQQNAMEHVFGYTILHDVSSRYIQFKDNNEMMGKNFETFSPIGPCIVTADEIPYPEQCRLTLKLNGQVMQDGTNQDWCFSLSRLIEWLTMAITMYPGDIVSTGTPSGIGYFRKPQVFLKPGDICELEISGIGKLINPVIDEPYTFYTSPKS